MAQVRSVRWRNWFARMGYTIDLWNVYTNKLGQCGLFASCVGPDGSEHTFDF